MENEYHELWILMYKQDIGSFFGSFLSDINQWFVMSGKLPMTFNSRQKALQYALNESLIECTAILWADYSSSLVSKKSYI